ncbi:hypothetical protein DFH28DRAFT_1131879 [Melampsora americana]|nr:hypothetical protein DFH28DRAFT_1131879 [Melampsora americana]
MALTRRGPLEIFMDPSDVSSTKDAMIDWLRINFPMVSIPSGAKTEDVARIVRQQQPHLFPDPTSNHRATESNDLAVLAVQPPYPLLPNINRGSPSETYPPTTSVPQVKRGAPSDLTSPTHPKNKLALSTKSRGDHKKSIKKALPSQQKSKLKSYCLKISKRAKANRANTHQDQAGAVLNTCTDASKKELDALQESLSTDSKVRNTDTKEFNARQESCAAPFLGKPDKRPALSVAEDPWMGDLIALSDLDCFEVENLVIGDDIPPIQPLSKTKSGVDIFIEGRIQAQKVSMLEQTVAHLQEKVDAAQSQSCSDMFEIEKRKDEQNYIISTLRTAIEKIEKQLDNVGLLEEKVVKLEAQVENLNLDLDRAHQEICTHEEIITKLMNASDSEDEMSENDNASSNSSAAGYL